MSKWKLQCTNGTHRAHLNIIKGGEWSWECEEKEAVWGDPAAGRASSPDESGSIVLGPGIDYLEDFLDVKVGSTGKGTRNGVTGSFPADGKEFDWLCTEKE
ncbi:MAG: hypothetical protein HS105_05375 [Chloracidobacterium sp.]|nr:hypothetical protein [Chloracidobacterium sp.]